MAEPECLNGSVRSKHSQLCTIACLDLALRAIVQIFHQILHGLAQFLGTIAWPWPIPLGTFQRKLCASGLTREEGDRLLLRKPPLTRRKRLQIAVNAIEIFHKIIV